MMILGALLLAQSAVEGMKAEEAVALRPLATTQISRDFLAAVSRLPTVKSRTIKEKEYDETFYYYTRYGTPLAYLRPLEVLGTHGVSSFGSKKILDFGYDTIGHLRLFAEMGANAVGVDVDPLLKQLYSGDTGKVGKGSVTLAEGHWPSTEEIRNEVGGGCDIILSKNTLKMGYVHPASPVDKRMLVDLGVTDEQYLKEVHDALKPGVGSSSITSPASSHRRAQDTNRWRTVAVRSPGRCWRRQASKSRSSTAMTAPGHALWAAP